ncbi:hypothetical protein FRC17_004804 [Serendipita sp. 399]|nr:hypothetical protein FRC17_004804 [Serendipita sp. 399]
MNATETHSKVRVTLDLSSPVFVAGGEVSGKMELDCRTDKGLGINTMMVELVAVQELTSRDHSATSTFISSKRIFQGPNLPPSNAVFAHPQPGAPPLPPHYHQARKGCTTFFFTFPIPESSPNSISFGNGLAKITYEVRATVAAYWKGERTSVKSSKEVTITECLVDSRVPKEPSTLVAEGGKMVVRAQVVGGIGVTGRPACVELHVKNHSLKKTTGLTLTLTRTLHLATLGTSKNPFQITDTIVTVPFRGSEYTIGPGVEGVANLVFDIPRNARGVKGGTREVTDDGDHRHTEALFHVSTLITVNIGMGVGSPIILPPLPTHGNLEGAAAVTGHTEEGKGERASRISLHLKSSSRTRSVSPTSHRYRMSALPINTLQAPTGTRTLHETPQSSPEVLSPRPMLSPKASFSGEPVVTGGQSGRVAALEKMVEEEEQEKEKSSSRRQTLQQVDVPNDDPSVPRQPQVELEATELAVILDKTLPPPPKLSSKPRKKPDQPQILEVFNLPPASNEPAKKSAEQALPPVPAETTKRSTEERGNRPRDGIGSSIPNAVKAVESPKDTEQTPSPTHHRIQPKPPGGLGTHSGGLDALEQRLTKEVGTRKPPAAVLQQLRKLDELTEDAIQERVEEERKLDVEKRVKPTDGSFAATVAPSDEKAEEIHPLLKGRRKRTHDADKESNSQDAKRPPNGLTKQEEEALRLRKAAKGRVAAWLGDAADADPPPPTETRIVDQAAQPYPEYDSSLDEDSIEVAKPAPKVDPSKIQLPGRRSSGFMPISQPLVSPKRVTAGRSGDPPPREPAIKKGLVQQLQAKSGAPYDIRSARGGKGGIVTSVAALWAEKASNEPQSPPPTNGVPLPAVIRLGKEQITVPKAEPGDPAAIQPKPFKYSSAALNKVLTGEGGDTGEDSSSPATKPKVAAWNRTGLTPARSTPNNLGIKAPSVPAKLSSSIAKPLISSTASLARPQPQSRKSSDTLEENDQSKPTPARAALPPSASEPRLASKPVVTVAFGQGRLKDLIAKYQGNGQS